MFDVDALLDELADRIAARLNRPRVVELTQRDEAALAELGLTSRSYLEAARAGAFPFTHRGRLVVARFDQVRAWRERPRLSERPENDTPAPSLDAEVAAELGLRRTKTPPKRTAGPTPAASNAPSTKPKGLSNADTSRRRAAS